MRSSKPSSQLTHQKLNTPEGVAAMTLIEMLALLLLLGLATRSQATSLCEISQDATRCVCDFNALENRENLVCLQVSELELRDGKLDLTDLELTMKVAVVLQAAQINKLTFNNVTISLSFVSTVTPFLPLGLNEINIISSTLERSQFFFSLDFEQASSIKTLRLEDVTVDPSFLHRSNKVVHEWLLPSLNSLSLVRSGLVKIDCSWAQKVQNLIHLDLSENPISYSSLGNMSSCSSLSPLKSLSSLLLRRSNLTSLQSLCSALSLAPALTQLDVSGNNLSTLHFPRCLQVMPLRMLNLSHSGITEVNSLLSESLEELDLSYNSLEVFNNPPQALRKLYLSNNRLIRLPSLDHLSQLQELKVDSNQLTVLIRERDASLSTLEQLDTLHAGRNPYQCDCALKQTVTFLDNTDMDVFVEDFPGEFLCATPAAQRGAQITNLSLETCSKATSETQHRASALGLTLFVGLLPCLIYFC